MGKSADPAGVILQDNSLHRLQQVTDGLDARVARPKALDVGLGGKFS